MGNWNCYLDCGNFKEYPSRLAVPVEIRVPQIMEKIAVPPAMPHHFCIIISTLRLLLYRDIHDIMSPYGYSFERLTMRR